MSEFVLTDRRKRGSGQPNPDARVQRLSKQFRKDAHTVRATVLRLRKQLDVLEVREMRARHRLEAAVLVAVAGGVLSLLSSLVVGSGYPMAMLILRGVIVVSVLLAGPALLVWRRLERERVDLADRLRVLNEALHEVGWATPARRRTDVKIAG